MNLQLIRDALKAARAQGALSEAEYQLALSEAQDADKAPAKARAKALEEVASAYAERSQRLMRDAEVACDRDTRAERSDAAQLWKDEADWVRALKTKGVKCEGCDKPKEGPHRFSCSVAGKRQLVLSVNLPDKETR